MTAPRPMPLAGHVSAAVVLGGMALWVACAPETFEIPLPSSSEGATSGDTSLTTAATDTTAAATEPEPSTSTGGTGGTCTPQAEAEAWWDTAWRRRRGLDVDASGLMGPLSNFPVLLRLSPDDLGSTWADLHGSDLRFRSDDQTAALDYDIDDVDPEGRLLVWLKVPELDPGAGPLLVWMYADNPVAEPGASPAAVWGEHVSVHHLGSSLQDSTGSHDGTTQFEPPVCEGTCEPKLGRARSFTPLEIHEVVLEGSADLAFGSDPYASTFAFSVSLWLRSNWFASNPWGPMVAKGDGTWRFQTFAATNDIAVGLDCVAPCGSPVDALGNYNLAAEGFGVNDGQWHHVAMTFGPDVDELPIPLPMGWDPDVRVQVYVDGDLAIADVLTGFNVPTDGQSIRFAHNANTGARFRGDLDEVRISADERTHAWIHAERATVEGELVSFAQAEVLCP